MTVGEYLKHSTELLTSNSIKTARLDSLILMEYILNTDRAKLLAESDMVISRQQKNVLDQVLGKRAKHIPISQITQKTEFYGRDFYINKNVLEPRPESETMIDLFKVLIAQDPLLAKQSFIKVADVGTGSGALGITAALESSKVRVDLVDIDPKALKVAKRNAVLYTIRCDLVLADILSTNETKYDILLCNLPYVPDHFQINTAATHEPAIAIFGGKDGLDIYRKLFKLLIYRQQKPLYILSESLPPYHKQLEAIAMSSSYVLQTTDDFIQLYKFQL